MLRGHVEGTCCGDMLREHVTGYVAGTRGRSMLLGHVAEVCSGDMMRGHVSAYGIGRILCTRSRLRHRIRRKHRGCQELGYINLFFVCLFLFFTRKTVGASCPRDTSSSTLFFDKNLFYKNIEAEF